MAQHFLLSRQAKTLNLASIFKMTDGEVETTFRTVRWPETQGAPICAHCGGLDAYEARRPSGALRFRCKACGKDFTLTSGTLFASHKMPLRSYLFAVVIFCNEVKGKSMLALSRDLGTSYKTAFVLAHKMREAMSAELKGRMMGGEGKTVEVDGGYFGGYVKPANKREQRVDRRLAENQSGKRKVVVVIRERGGNTLPGVFPTEAAALSFIRARVHKDTIVNADEAAGWNELHARFEMRRINHQLAYSDGEACTNQAELFFSRLRRAEIGHHHHVAGAYLLRYAQEAAWREDNRRLSNGDQVNAVAGLAMTSKPSVDFCGYPAEHVPLLDQILPHGAAVTEMPLGWEPRGRDFPRRNRLISGLAVGVVIVEAARRSGSLITARMAAEQGREVFAVPGSPLDPRAEGTNGLLKQGATLVTEAADVLSVIRPILGQLIDQPAEEPGDDAPRLTEPASDERARIVGLLGPAPVSIDDLVRLSRSSAAVVRTVLLELELAGRLERHGGGLISLV